MIITISGLPGSGKTSVAKLLAKKLGYKFYSMGDIIQTFVLSKKMTLSEFNKLRNKDKAWDYMIDGYQKELGKKSKNVIFDGITSFFLFPDSLKVFLSVEPEVGARRIFNDRRPDEPYRSFSEALKAVRRRIKDDRARYKRLYRIDCHKLGNFDLIIDTSDLSKEEVADAVLGFIKRKL